MRRHLGVVSIAGVCGLWAAVVCGAQSTPASNPAPCSVAPQPDPCGTTPAPSGKSSTMQKFPFPGEAGSSSGADTAAPSLSGAPVAPQAPDAPDASSAAAAKKAFPFPGDASAPDASGGSSSSSSSSSSGDDASPVDPGANPDGTPALKDKGSEGNPTTPGRHILHRVNPVGTKLQSADERELEAHIALAEIAMKLNKKDEAIAEYSACLKLDPTDKQAKEARKALASLKH